MNLDLSTLNFKTWQTACIAYANVSSEKVNVGDAIVFYNEDTRSYELGIYLNLWHYISEGRETSPLLTEEGKQDSRHMALVATQTGGTQYADILSIRKHVHAVPSMEIA